jgi:hypothetical protein
MKSVIRKSTAAGCALALSPVVGMLAAPGVAAADIGCATTNTPTKGFGGVGGSVTYHCGVSPDVAVGVVLLESPNGTSGWTQVASVPAQTLSSDPLTLTAFYQHPTSGRYYKTESFFYWAGFPAGDSEESAAYLYKA